MVVPAKSHFLVKKQAVNQVVKRKEIMNNTTRKAYQQTYQSPKVLIEFDASGARLNDRDMFHPFHVKTTRPLREVLASGDVREDTTVLVMERDAGVLALLTQQMSYHHVAQGEMAGEPWLVSF